MKNFISKSFFVNLYFGACNFIANLKSKKSSTARADEGCTASHFLAPEATPMYSTDPSDANLFISSDSRFKIRIEKHPNKDIRTYHTSEPLYATGSTLYTYEFPSLLVSYGEKLRQEGLELIVERFYSLNKCKQVNFHAFNVSFHKTPAASWDEIEPKVLEIIFKHLEENPCRFQVVN